LLIALATTISGMLFYQFNLQPAYDNTVLYAVGLENPQSATDSLENLQAADLFTESIQGWFRDPAFLKQISTSAQGQAFPIKSKKQEKNNLLITFSSDSQENAINYASAITLAMETRLQQYNNISGLNIAILPGGVDSVPGRSQLAIVLLVALLCGLLFGFLCTYLLEKLFNSVQSVNQVREHFPDTEIFNYESRNRLKKNSGYLLKFLETHLPPGQFQLLNFTTVHGSLLENIFRHLKHHQISPLQLPKQIEQVSTSQPSILLLQFGKTSHFELEQFSKLGIPVKAVVIIN
jgi:capsular polysaccharide biosynthesis protein